MRAALFPGRGPGRNEKGSVLVTVLWLWGDTMTKQHIDESFWGLDKLDKFQRFNPSSSWWEGDRHSTGAVAENSTSRSTSNGEGRRKRRGRKEGKRRRGEGGRGKERRREAGLSSMELWVFINSTAFCFRLNGVPSCFKIMLHWNPQKDGRQPQIAHRALSGLLCSQGILSQQ